MKTEPFINKILLSRILKLLLIASIVYAPCLLTGIVNDDAFNIYNASRSGWSLSELSRAFVIDPHGFHDGIVPDCLGQTTRYFRPLIMASFKLDTVLFGNNFNLYHLQNILLALCTALMVYILARKLLPDEPAAYLASILFILCPVNFFTVYWISARTDLLCTFFMMISLLLFIRFIEYSKNIHYYPTLSLALVFYLLSLLAKEGTVMMPFFIFLISRYLIAERDAGDRKKVIVTSALYAFAYLLVFAAYFFVRTCVLGGIHYPAINFYSFPVNDPLVIYFAIQKYVWMFLTMTFFVTPFPIKMFFYSPTYNVIFIIALVFSIWVFGKLSRPLKNSKISKILLWLTVLSFVPTLPLLPGPHYCYIPSIFYCMLIAMYLRYKYYGETAETKENGIIKYRIEASVDEYGPSYPKAKKAYLAVYAFAGFLSAAILLALFYLGGYYNQRVCEIIEKVVDKYHASDYFKKTKEPPEIYLFDVGGPPMIFDEFRFRHPDKKDFKGFIVNVGALTRSIVSIRTGEVTVTAAGMPLFSGFIEEFANSGKFEFIAGKNFKCGHYEMVVEKTAKNSWTQNTGISEFKLIFNEKTSAPKRRIYLDVYRGTMSGAL